MQRLSILLTTVVLIAGMVGCVGGHANNGDGSYTLIVDFTTGGTVAVDGLPIPGKALLNYDAGTVVSLGATPSAGYRFIEWTGNAATIDDVNAASTSVTMNDDYQIIANFEEEGEGDCVPDGTSYCVFCGFPDRFFEESSVPREQVEQVVSAQYLSLKNMHNGITPYGFCRVEYDPEAYGYTTPYGIRLGDYAFPSLNDGHHRWEVMAHEQGHNFFGGTSWFYYKMAAPYPFLQESLAVLSAFYTYHDIIENQVGYGIDDESIDSLVFDFTNGRTYQESMYNRYISEGKNFSLGNSSDILTSQALDFKMITYGEIYGWHNFENLTKAFENQLDAQFSFLDNGASATEQSSYIVAALNVAFQRDFTQEFIDLEFPIDSSLLQELTTILEQYIY
jgi:hypothetical protein